MHRLSPWLLCCWLLPLHAADYAFEFPPLKQPIALNAQQLAELQQQGRVSDLSHDGDRGEAWLVQDVPLARDALWRLILDFDRYAERVDALSASRTLDERVEGESRLIRTEYRVSALFVNIDYPLVHQYRPADHYMRWTLDPDADNDMERVEGYWLLTEHPERAGWTRAHYGARLTFTDWLPGFISRALAELGLRSTSQWLTDAEQFD